MKGKIDVGVRFADKRIERYASTRIGGYTPKIHDDAMFEMMVDASGTTGGRTKDVL